MGVRVIVILALVGICGCEPPAASTATKSGPPPPPAVGVQLAEGPGGAESPVVPPPVIAEPVVDPAPFESTEPAAATPDTEASAPPADSRQPIIRLSAGVALPQLLPDGTQIGVSVDYKMSGRLNTSARYVLVVESIGGRISLPVEISAQGGTIQGFLPAAVRPEHKPFKAWVDELSPGSGRSVTVSNRLDLQTSY